MKPTHTAPLTSDEPSMEILFLVQMFPPFLRVLSKTWAAAQLRDIRMLSRVIPYDAHPKT